MTKAVILSDSPEILARDGLTETIQPWEDGLRAPTGSGSFEWWYFDAHFDDPDTDPGTQNATAVIVFATKPLLERSSPLKPLLSITITRPDGSKIAAFPIFSPAEFNASSDNCDVKIGDNWCRGDLHEYELQAGAADISAHLRFEGIAPAWRPGAGKSFFGDTDHYFAWLPSIPYGSVEGEITFDGKTYRVKGSGYHDHNWGNIGLEQVMDHWYWGRAHVGEYTLIYVEQVSARDYAYTRVPVFMLAKGDQLLTGDGTCLTMEAHSFTPHPEGRAYPSEVDFHWRKGADQIEIKIRRPELIESSSLLLTFPALQRAVMRLFANPYYFRFNAQMDLKIKLNGLEAVEHGPTLFEIMILQGKNHP